ncbi:LOW QUALITY PROTEIN: nidogen-2 [Lates calcarifer]|uniref:LOW QUALITY PROTEIN: nidogen-2 n=1 Tax=Lates calcarifer TaxID=8187 RepID=A0AAJ8AWX7_LATCA|nr:LOW QUALITY PROTEIN: nidogen-2 [Lates calcarifer]
MERGEMLAVCLLLWSCSVCVVTAIQRADMFPYGTLSGDSVLMEGDDETSKVLPLPKPLYFYNTQFKELYVATNGIISPLDLPMEKQYVDDGFPTDFPVVAPFLADIDTSDGRGQIYYRVTETPSILNRVAQEVHRGFPDSKFIPTHAVVATWENVAAYDDHSVKAGPSNKFNTFQAVIGYDETDSYVLFLYPEGGLNFFATRPKESYNVEIELPARVGFSRGEIPYFLISRIEGPHYSVTSEEQSVKNLYQVGNTGIPGVWLFHTGNRNSFDNIIPASIGGLLATSPSKGHGFPLETTTPEYAEFEEYPDNTFDPDNEEEEDDYPLTGRDPEFQTAPAGGDHSEPLQPASPDAPSSPSEHPGHQVLYENKDVPLTSDPGYGPEPAERQFAPPSPPKAAAEEDPQQPQVPLEVVDVYPPHRNEPRLSPGGHVVSVDEEDVDFDTGVIHYTTENKETCARFQQQCSQNAFCSDYATGFCCHCRPGFYGNGRHCLPEGAPQRVSGKVSGTVTVGSTPVQLNNIDLHAYIVVGDGRAYTAISEVPEPVGWALMPVAPIGELFGWLFALELPNSQAGFKMTGAEFTRRAEVIFYPGNERLSIIQTGRGLDDHNHLTVDTVVSGSVPFLPPGAEVTMDPFKETYQYYPSVATSTSVREYSVVSAEQGSESFSFQLKQNITYRDCRHDNRAVALETLQITMERVFVMYVKEERILRYAITNKISPVGGESNQNIDECAEGLSSCGAHAQCVNLPGSHRCQCQSGYEFGFDGRTCVDMDECSSSPCHVNARCINGLGSFQCQCQPGFYGDGFYCSQQEGQTVRPKSQCELHRDSLQSGVELGGRPRVGAFIPQCDSDGRYRPLQCHGSTGHCWCVDSSGQERAGTRTPPGTAPKDCDRPDEPERPKTYCEQHRDSVQTTSPEGYPIPGVFVPQCDDNGQYRPLQCHGSSGHCWCVDSRGQERPGTRTPPGTPSVDCDRPDEPERPKTQCEYHRDSLQTTSPEGYPIVGAYVPQCDANGQYIPLQCHGSSGHCWCVDSRGQERAGTRTSPGAPPTDCDKPDEPERPKTHCEHHRDSVQTTSPEGYPLLGAYVPQCDDNGQYVPQQCHSSTGYCWCVDSRGQERRGTRTPPGTPSVDCDRPDEPERPKTHCEHHRDSVQTTSPEGYPLLGAYVPQCDDNGQYVPQQCHSSTGYCWCVDSRGQERRGTRTPPGTPSVDCDRPDEPERPKTHCEHHRDSVQTTSPEGYPLLGAYVPQCDDNGQYVPQQCHSSTGYCWCVDSRGQERRGTRTPPGTPSVDCDRPDEPERPKTHCEHHRDSVQTTSPEGYPLLGAYVPQCDDNGQYVPQQCHSSTGYCWCVDSRGQERRGTRTPPGTPSVDCDRPDEPERPKTYCEQHRDSVQTTSAEGYPIPGVFVPQCDANGQYTPQQCHGSSGHCWCVDSRGQERAGTRTPPGTPSVDCDKPDEQVRPKTHCEHHRDSVQTTSPEGYPIVGAYVPQCDAEGQYLPRQCHGSSGHCWCVDSKGEERAGTRTPPGAPSVDCDRPDEPVRPKTHCEHHRDSVQTTSPEGYPIVGAYVPQCDAEGQYLPRQCHGSSGHCWCVDSRGQERAGTRTPPGTPRVDCDKPVPVAPTQRPESVCERWRASLIEHYGGKPEPQQYVPQCEPDGQFSPVQCYGETTYCWCVDQDGREVPGTRSHDVVKPACLPSVAPPTIRPLPRPDVTPPTNTDVILLYAQGQKIGALPLNGTRLDATHSKTLLTLHGSIVVGIAYDCKENQVYWTDLSARTINRASMAPGAEPEILINTNLVSPEGLAVDVKRRLIFWVDSNPDMIESANLDGSGRQTLFDTDLVNPRAIIVVSSTGTLYWTDWNREAPKIECSSVDGQNRRVVVSDGIGLPNALTYDSSSGQICWADAGTKRLECIFPDGSGRRVIHPSLNYPFSMVYYRNHFYYTDWRRDGVIAVSKDSSQFTDEYLPDQRSHLYGIAIATTQCLSGSH